ncbi:MAG: PleD family two-component system response regulator [Alphaproteobacteria bacterium]|nr:MAG: PleD family two-component system response regulator [Alphaproteobacteria bacterium]TMJ39778.1 MAG: PleD family two-component system response regulator [Alphaproteobacteria bacterium]
MTARVLVVDDILANVRLLEAKLSAEYFDVVTAMNGADALDSIQRTKPDIVLLDVMMPGIDGVEVCRQIKNNAQTHHIPVVMVTALDQPEDRIKGLEAGADDFLTKPVNDLALFCRVKSLVRLKMLTDELRARSPNGETVTLMSRREDAAARPGKILVIDNRAAASERTRAALVPHHEVTVIDDPLTAVMHAAETRYELIIINLDMDNIDGLRLCSQLKSLERTRQTPILIVVAPDDHQRLLRALDMGVNDYLIRPIDKQELLARANTQIRRCRYTDQLRSHVQATMELAVTDPLTGLYNRRYMENQTAALVEHAINRGKALALLALDVDHFKMVNDENGHPVGDRVLQELASRLKQSIRNIDMICRIGGEEFVIVLPNTDAEVATKIADRMRRGISGKPFDVGAKNGPLTVTVSIGVAAIESQSDTLEAILKRADEALYSAKRGGRNRVNSTAA